IGYNCGYLLKRRKVLVVPEMPKHNLSRNVDTLLSRHLKDTVTPIRERLSYTELTTTSTRSEDYTIISKPRAVIYRDRNDQKKMMMENEVRKFSDGTLTRVLHKLDHMVKYFRLFKYNPGMENKIWYEDDRRRIEKFMKVIEKILKIRRIFRSLESFVGGRFRDVDYRTLNRTE
nr:hypothetical protein [Tanacetum cinerariifolium]